MKHIYKKWLLIANDYSGIAFILSFVVAGITKLDILNTISYILGCVFISSGIILFCNDYYVTRSIRATIKKNGFMFYFMVGWIIFALCLALLIELRS